MQQEENISPKFFLAETDDVSETPAEPDVQECEDVSQQNSVETSELEKISRTLDSLAKRIEALEQIGTVSSHIHEMLERSELDRSEIMREIEVLKEGQEKNERKLAQALRENANFQIQVRGGMQHDLDELKSRVSGEQLIPVLKEISEMYVDYIFLTECGLSAEEIKKNLKMMFSQMEDFFEEYGADVCVSSPGTQRKSRSCRVVSKVPTDDPEKHNTVVRSRKPGVIKDKAVLQPEYIDLYVYEASEEEQKTENN